MKEKKKSKNMHTWNKSLRTTKKAKPTNTMPIATKIDLIRYSQGASESVENINNSFGNQCDCGSPWVPCDAGGPPPPKLPPNLLQKLIDVQRASLTALRLDSLKCKGRRARGEACFSEI